MMRMAEVAGAAGATAKSTVEGAAGATAKAKVEGAMMRAAAAAAAAAATTAERLTGWARQGQAAVKAQRRLEAEVSLWGRPCRSATGR
jgi:hypothetical protein